VNQEQLKAKDLLLEWHSLRNSAACAYIFDIQECKDKLEDLAALLSVQLYCSPVENLCNITVEFEHELNQLKQNVHIDLLAGLKK